MRGLVAVCLAVHRPDPELLERQLASLDAQTYSDWTLVRVDDAEGIGPYRAFERAFEWVPPEARFVAPCDQDDVWHPDKLAVLVEALARPQVTLAFSDVRIVRPDGAVLSPTYWTDRSHACDSMTELLATNVVTGAASVVRRDVLDVALPFPPELDGSFHDHWLALCALAIGEIAFVDRRLVDYVQHGGNVVGHAERRWRGGRSGLSWAARAARDRERHVLRPQVMAQALLERCGDRMAPAKRRAAWLGARGDDDWRAVAWILAGAAREAVAPRRTLDARRRAARGAVWRRAASSRARGRSRAGTGRRRQPRSGR